MALALSLQSFASYPPQGREVALAHLDALRQMPVALLPVFLVDLKNYDWKFPLEQQEIVRRMDFAQANPAALAGFRGIAVSSSLENSSLVSDPEQFLARMTAYLWASLQMDAYRQAADRFVRLFEDAAPSSHGSLPRLVMLCIGRDAAPPQTPLFQKLRRFGQLRTNVTTSGGADALLAALAERAADDSAAYNHWYIDGGSSLPGALPAAVTQFSYPAVAPINREILDRMMACIQAGSGPEVLHAELADPALHLSHSNAVTSDPRLRHFALSVLTEGSGTQIFSTTFVQWTVREVLRRAQPATLLARFAPRQRQKPFNAMVAAAARTTDLDPDGSLIDADMAAYYAYLEMMRLPGADRAAFLVWFEDHSLAFVAGPGVAAGTIDATPAPMSRLLSELAVRT